MAADSPEKRWRSSARFRRPERDYAKVDTHHPTGGPEAAAFFDFDKTLLHGDAGVIFGRSLAVWAFEQGQGLSPPARVAYTGYLAGRLGSTLAREMYYRSLYSMGIIKRSKLVEMAYRMMAGYPTTFLEEHLDRVWTDILSKRFYPQMLQVIDRHRALGQRVVIVSTGLRPIVEHARRYVGADVDVIACDMGHQDGRFTGLVQGPLYGVHKAQAIREYARSNRVDLARSYAYSDHFSDVAFLGAVGNPVAVNPRGRLRRYALRRGWTILDLPPPPA